MLKNKFLLLLAACFTYFYSFHVHAVYNGQSDNLIIVNADESSIETIKYEPFAPEFLYNKDFIKNDEALKNVKQKFIPLLVQAKKQSKDYNEALPYLEEAIKHGDLQSMIWLGEHYEIKGDLLKAIRWYLFVFHLHWLDTFDHHQTIIHKFNNLKEKYTALQYRNKNKKSSFVKFNNTFYNLSINNNKKKEIKKFLTSLYLPKNNFYSFYIKPSSKLNNIFLNRLESEIENIILNDSLPIKPNNKENLLTKARQKIYCKKIHTLNEIPKNEISEKEISETHALLGLQYYTGNIVNIDGLLNYKKAVKHFLLSQDSDIHYILSELYLEEEFDFQSILENPKEKKYHQKIKNLIYELSIQKNLEAFSNEYKNNYENSKNLDKIIQLLHLYKNKTIGKDLSKDEKKEKISLLAKNGLIILNDNDPNNYFYKGYIYYFTKQYENARKNFLLALKHGDQFDTSIIGLIDAHIQSEEYLKQSEHEKNISEYSSKSILNSRNEPEDNIETSTNSTEEFSNKDLFPTTINESTQKTIITKKLKQELRINKINHRIQKNYENIKKRQKKFKEKQKKHGILLNKNISTQETRNRKILFSSEKKPLTSKQTQIKRKYKQLIAENTKFQRLIEDVKINPWSGGEGQVEHLKRRGSYSRRINHSDRLEYRVNSDGDIIILAVEGHYDN